MDLESGILIIPTLLELQLRADLDEQEGYISLWREKSLWSFSSVDGIVLVDQEQGFKSHNYMEPRAIDEQYNLLGSFDIHQTLFDNHFPSFELTYILLLIVLRNGQKHIYLDTKGNPGDNANNNSGVLIHHFQVQLDGNEAY
jgi:hypothetical protein